MLKLFKRVSCIVDEYTSPYVSQEKNKELLKKHGCTCIMKAMTIVDVEGEIDHIYIRT